MEQRRAIRITARTSETQTDRRQPCKRANDRMAVTMMNIRQTPPPRVDLPHPRATAGHQHMTITAATRDPRVPTSCRALELRAAYQNRADDTHYASNEARPHPSKRGPRPCSWPV